MGVVEDFSSVDFGTGSVTAKETPSRPTQEQLDRWTAAYAIPDAGSLGAPAAPAQETANAAERALDTRPVVGRGSAGADIIDLQFKLDALGFDLGEADGIYGPKTEAAVRAFQAAQGISVDGVIGPETRQKLDALRDPNAAIDGGSLDPLIRSTPLSPTTNDNAAAQDAADARALAINDAGGDPQNIINPSTGRGYTDAELRELVAERDAAAQDTADARALAINDAGGDPQNIINPSTGRGYTDAELRELVAERDAAAQDAADARALAINDAGGDPQNIINPSTGRGYTDAELRELVAKRDAEANDAQDAADARALAINDAGGDPQNIINPSTGRGYTDAELRELVAERARSDQRDLPERVEVVRGDVGGSVGPFAFGNETVYTIEYLPNGDALVTKHTEAGAGPTGSWRAGGFINAGELGEAGGYLGGGAQFVVQRVEGETFRVPADQARDIVNRDITHFANDVGIIGIGVSGSNLDQPSPLETEGVLVRTTEGWERDSQADALAELGIHDADWLGPFENFIGQSYGGEYNYEYTTTTQHELETGNTSVRVDILESGELDVSALELQDAKEDDDPTVFGIDENPQRQSEEYVEIVSNEQGEVIQVIYGRSASDGETLDRTQWILDATDPAVAERIQTAMSEGGGSTGHGGLAELAETEGLEQSRSYDISGTSYGGGGDFFPVPGLGVGGSVNIASESYDTATG